MFVMLVVCSKEPVPKISPLLVVGLVSLCRAFFGVLERVVTFVELVYLVFVE